MSLPACQQRALDRMEGALRASEPHLASMYTMFGRLNASEPIGAEQLTRKRLRWLQPGTAMYAIVLVPVMFAAIIVGALLGGGTRSTAACEASYSVGGVSPVTGRPTCPVSGKTVEGRGAQDDLRHRAARLHRGTGRPVHHPDRERAGGPAGGAGVRGGGPARGVLEIRQGRRSRCRSSSSGMGQRNY